MDHEHIIKLKSVSLDGDYRKVDGRVEKVMYYVMKVAELGELYQIIENTPKFSESLARHYFK